MFTRTKLIHAGKKPDLTSGAITSPIYLSTTFERDTDGNRAPMGFYYTRIGNPNRTELEDKLNILEEGSKAFAFSSGMAAYMALFHAILQPGDHIIISDDCYHAVTHMGLSLFRKWNITCSEADMTDLTNLQQNIRPETKLIIIETPSNPLLKIADIEAIASIAKKKHILLLCDNTWATPYCTNPLMAGADFVIHSTTKYLGGHSDILGGCIIQREINEHTNSIEETQTIGGMVPSPFDCWLLNRSICTFPLRMKQQIETAAFLADALQSHPLIEKILYPGLAYHPNHSIAKKQMTNGYGAMLSIQIIGDAKTALRFASSLSLFKHATSLGGIESLIEHRRSAEGKYAKSPENLLRVSIGLENADDLLNDITSTFKRF